jgi:hypothetical protein
VKAVSDAPLIGHIPMDKSATKHPLLVGAATRGLRAEALRKLRTNLQFINMPAGRRSYVFTSPQQGDGKSTVALNLALIQAEAGLSVCLVDADLRRPSIAIYLSIEGSVGLTDIRVSVWSVGGTGCHRSERDRPIGRAGSQTRERVLIARSGDWCEPPASPVRHFTLSSTIGPGQ